VPPAAHELKLCRAEACQAMGADRLAAHASARLGMAMGEITPDARLSLEPVYCLGLCSVAPSAMLDGRVVGRLTEDKLDALLAEVAR
jgi:formate dehydrogenase subunit gamma